MYHVYYNFFYISNLFAKAPAFDLGKKLSNLLSNCEALNQQPAFLPSQKRTVLQCNAKTSVYTTGKQLLKKRFLYSNVYINTINTKKLSLFYKFINKKCHDIKYSDYESKIFLSLTNKHDFYSGYFSNLLICQQSPKQLET